jgi:hypothetical protein
MRRIAIVTAILGAAVTATPALAEGTWYVRNDTGESQTCTVRYPGSQAVESIVLRRGGDWSGTTRSDRTRTLICQTASRPRQFRLESGQRYSLTKTGAGVLVLSAAN